MGRTGKTFANVTAGGSYKWFDDRKSRPNCDGCTFRNLLVKPDRYGADITKSRDITFDNVTFEHRRPTTKQGDYAAGILISGGDNIVIRNSRFGFFKRDLSATDPKAYGQGDGIDCDSRKSRVEIWDSRAYDNFDGGFDLKCTVTLGGLVAERNYRNYRFWGIHTAAMLTSADPRNAHVWYSAGANGTIERLVASGGTGAAVFEFGSPNARPQVKACEFSFSVPTKVFRGELPADWKERFDRSCWPDAQGYAVNNPRP